MCIFPDELSFVDVCVFSLSGHNVTPYNYGKRTALRLKY